MGTGGIDSVKFADFGHNKNYTIIKNVSQNGMVLLTDYIISQIIPL